MTHLPSELIDHEPYQKDSLTGLDDRKKLFLDLKLTDKCILVLINIDGFSEINSGNGELVGNIVLQEVGRRINSFKDKKRAYRCGGDEFAVIINYQGESDNELKDKLLKLSIFIAKDRMIYDDLIENIHIGLTIGAAYGTRDLYINASAAFRIAKCHNKAVVIYNEKHTKIKEKFNSKNRESQRIKNAILHGELIPYYQPIFDNKLGRVVKYEALARLLYEGEIIYPDDFIEASKRAKIYTDITIKIIKQVLNDFEHKDEQVSINISTEDIFNREIVQRIEELLKTYGNAQKIVFEITESGKIPSYSILNDFTKRMRSHGVKISLDDFGTEYSNLAHLSNIEVEYLKIDGQFIKNCDVCDKNYKILEAIVGLSKKLNIKTVAEYVESKEIHDITVGLGIDYAQGFLFGKAQRIEELGVKHD